MMFKDYSGPSGNVFQFVQHWAMYHEGIPLGSNQEIVMYIKGKLGISTGVISRKITTPEKPESSEYLISVYPKYQTQHLEYLNDLGIDLELAEHVYFTKACESLMDEYQRVIQQFRGTTTFAYIIYNKFKLYQPYEENFKKFFNHCPANYVQGFPQCRVIGQDTLMITKSFKDILVVQSHIEEWLDIIAPHGEGYNISPEWIEWYLQYKRIIIMYDPDLAGLKGLNRIRKAILSHPKYSGQEVLVRFIWEGARTLRDGKMVVPVKDPAEYRLIYGRTKTEERLKQIIYG